MQRIGFVVYPGFHLLSLAALSVFEFANLETGDPAYGAELLSLDGGPVRGSIGVTVATALVTGARRWSRHGGSLRKHILQAVDVVGHGLRDDSH